jgi:uncharacterized protein
MKFEWDPIKDNINLRKHGVSFEEASAVFGDFLSLSGRDLAHSVGEHRFVTFGVSSHGRVLAVYHTDRGGVVRIYSARPATRKEKRIYEEG